MSSPPPVIKLASPPLKSKSADPYVWADYIELLCLVNIDHRVSKSDVLDRVGESRDLGDIMEIAEDADASGLGLLADESEDASGDLAFYLDGPGIPASGPSYSETERCDIDERKADRWFEHLNYRSNAFKDFYPFALSRGVLHCKDNAASDPKCRLYIFTLLSSCLKYIRNTQYLTDRFEVVSLVALKNYLPKRGKVRFVGKNVLNQAPGYNSTLWTRIHTLAEEIGDPVTSRYKKSKPSPHNTGDGGLDVVGWATIGDNEPGRLLLFGQCGCGKDWLGKLLEAHPINWKRYIDFIAPPSNLVFIPYCYRNPDGTWYDSLDITECILIDRLRLVHLLRDKLPLLKRYYPFDELVNQVVEYIEPLV